MKKTLLKITFAFIALGFTLGAGAQTIWTQNFSTASVPSLPTGWTNSVTGGATGWQTANAAVAFTLGSVPSVAPDADFAFVNDYGTGVGPYDDPATMQTTAINISGYANPWLAFDAYFDSSYDYRTDGGTDTFEYAYVNASTSPTGPWTLLGSIYADGGWATQYMNLSAYAGTTTLYLQFVYTDHNCPNNGVAVGNINIFNAQANNIAIVQATPVAGDLATDYAVYPGTIALGGIMQNLSPNSITSFQATYKVGAAAPVTATITTPGVAPMEYYTFSITPAFSLTALDKDSFTVWVTETGDPVLTNDTLGSSFIGVTNFPAKRVMVEECNGTWCGYCVRGIVYMDSLWKNYQNDVTIVSVHDEDSMSFENASTEGYDSWSGTKISGYPSIIIDRNYVTDPSSWFSYIPTMNSWFAYATMNVTATIVGTTLTASTTVTPAYDLNGSYQLAYVVEEMNVFHPSGGDATSGDWSQHDYYSTDMTHCGYASAGSMAGCGYNFTDSTTGGVCSGDAPMYMHYHFVDRMTWPASFDATPNGVAGSLPTTMTAGTPYTYGYNFTIASDWSAPNLQVICMLIDNNPTSNTYGQVLNSQVAFSPVLGVQTIKSSVVDAFKVVPNPAADFANATFTLNDNTNISVKVYDVLGRVVISTQTEAMTAGEHTINLATGNLVSGVYNVVITTDNGNMTQQLSVVK